MVHVKNWGFATSMFLQARFCFCYSFVFHSLIFPQINLFPLLTWAAFCVSNPFRITIVMFLCISVLLVNKSLPLSGKFVFGIGDFAL